MGYPCSGMSINTAYRLTFGSAVFVSGLGKIRRKKNHPSRVAKGKIGAKGNRSVHAVSRYPSSKGSGCRTCPVQPMEVIIRRVCRAMKSTLTMLVIVMACIAMRRRP